MYRGTPVTRTARKQHTCTVCNGIIPAGSRYVDVRDHRLHGFALRYHVSCAQAEERAAQRIREDSWDTFCEGWDEHKTWL